MPLFLLFCLLGPTFSYASDAIPVRTSARDGLARIVLDTKGKGDFTLDKSQKGKVILKISKEASLNLGGADFTIFASVKAPQVLSEDPLTLSFSVPEGAKVRAYEARGKIYLEVSDKAQKKANSKPAVVSDENNKPQTSASGVAEVSRTQDAVKMQFEPEFKAEKEIKDKIVKQKTSAKGALPAVPPAPVVEAEPLVSGDAHQNAQALQDAAGADLTTLSVTSTSMVDVAVFEDFGKLVWVVNQDSFSLAPNPSGPKAELFGELSSLPIKGGRAFFLNVPSGLKMKAQGGALLWRLAFKPVLQDAQGVSLLREGVKDDGVRGGKLVWPVKDTGPILEMPDPVTGQILKVITVKDAVNFVGPAQSFVDFDILHSPIGMVIRPKVDDLKVSKTPAGIEISRPKGLALSSEANAPPAQKGKLVDLDAPKRAAAEGLTGAKPSIFRFADWKIGSLDALNQSKNAILTSMQGKNKAKRIEDLMTLAKMHLAHGRGPEALGFLEFASQEMPELSKNPEFLALRGIARAFDWKSEIAFNDLSHDALKPYDEIAYWRSFVLADLGDWQQAYEILPQDYSYIHEYPEMIADRLALSLAEVNLRAGKVKAAEELLDIAEKHQSTAGEVLKPAVNYLRGEVERQKGNKEETAKIWEELTKDKDDYYRARAGLALTRLLRDQKKITNKEAIDRLERLRYAWRGDELEAQINYWLGHAYFEDKEYIKGLTIMRDAASIAADTVLGQRIAQEMRETFSDLFLKAKLQNVSPLDSVALYEQFAELTPAGEQGDQLVQVLAEQLVKSDLLERGSKLLQQQVDQRLQGEEKARVALKLAAIYLMDKQPKRALRAISTVMKTIKTLPPESTYGADHQREITLLTARAYAQAGHGDKGLALLKNLQKDSDVSRLKADIAWQAGYWADAAEALNDVILNENIPTTRPPTDNQRDLIMNQAIALNLANDRIALANLREKYKDIMLQTASANQFELITRPRRASELADKNTLMSIMSEVDLFKNFLEGYKAADQKPDGTKPAADKKVN